MVEYHCILCSYTTNLKPHYERHCKTKKHLGKVKEIEEQKKEEEKICQPLSTQCQPNVNLCQPLVKHYHCDYCNKNFNTRQGKSKHQKICREKEKMSTKCQPLSTKNEPKMNPNEPKMNPNEPKMNPNEPLEDTITKKHTKKHICLYCNKEYSTNSHLRRHEKTCKVKKEEYEKSQNKDMQIEILKKENNKGTLINQNNYNINNTINYLNLNFQNMQTIENFLENLKNKYQLSLSDRKCLLSTFNECGIDAFAETFSIIMKKYQSEQVEKGLLPTMPIVCTDGNLRSMKEYHENGWQTTYSDSNIDKMIDISNDQIYESENTKVFLNSKDRKKIHNRIKKDNTLINLEEIKKNYLSKKKSVNNVIEIEKENNLVDEKNKIDFVNSNYDFSIINDEYIEKFSKI